MMCAHIISYRVYLCLNLNACVNSFQYVFLKNDLKYPESSFITFFLVLKQIQFLIYLYYIKLNFFIQKYLNIIIIYKYRYKCIT